jgi:hypothetical protein
MVAIVADQPLTFNIGCDEILIMCFFCVSGWLWCSLLSALMNPLALLKGKVSTFALLFPTGPGIRLTDLSLAE